MGLFLNHGHNESVVDDQSLAVVTDVYLAILLLNDMM